MWPFTRKAVGEVTVPAVSPAGSLIQSGVWVDISAGGQTSIDRTTREMLVEYTRSIYLWRCVDLIASTNGSVPLYVATENERTLMPPEAALQRLLGAPNPQWTLEAVMYFLAASLAVANRAYLKLVRGVGGVTLELWPIRSDQVSNRVLPNTDIITGFEVGTGVKKEFFPVAANGDCDIIFITRPALNAKSDKSPAAVAAPPAEVFTRILQRCADIVANTSNITGLLSTKSEVGETVIQKIKDKLQQFRTGGPESGGTIVAGNAEWNLTRLSDDPSSALSPAVKDSLARDVCMVFGVPTQLVGIPGNDTYNNMNTARVSFITETVLPGYTNIIVAALSAMLCRDMAGTIEADLDGLPAMVQARLALVDIASKADMLSLNEQRELMGWPKIDDPLADIPVKLEELRLKRLQIEIAGGVAGDINASLAGAET